MPHSYDTALSYTNREEDVVRSTSRKAKTGGDRGPGCVICGLPATTLDRTPGCSDHVALIYEEQLEHSTKAQLRMPQSLNGEHYGQSWNGTSTGNSH